MRLKAIIEDDVGGGMEEVISVKWDKSGGDQVGSLGLEALFPYRRWHDIQHAHLQRLQRTVFRHRIV